MAQQKVCRENTGGASTVDNTVRARHYRQLQPDPDCPVSECWVASQNPGKRSAA